MPDRNAILTGAAGEHYVAYRLSAMGYPAALTRLGSPAVDLMVGDISGNAAVSVQVKTSAGAWRERSRNPDDSHWEWPVGRKGIDLRGDSIFYVFVDLKWETAVASIPDVFVVPSADVANSFPIPESLEWTMWMFWIFQRDKEKYHENWEPLVARLGQPLGQG